MEKEVNLEIVSRGFHIREHVVQGNYNLKECNMSMGYPEDVLKMLFLAPENKIKVLMDELQALAFGKP